MRERWFMVSAVALVGYALLGAIDGLYLHLFRFRLHERAPREHLWHTLRALVFPPVLLLVLSGRTTGLALWVGVAIALGDVTLAVGDVLEERSSRAFQRGLPRYEFAIHLAASALHLVALGASLAARPASAWVSGELAPPHVAASASAFGVAVWGLLPGALAVALLHVVLLARTRGRSVREHPTPSLVAEGRRWESSCGRAFPA